jgi:hypothetical protein
MQYHDEDGDWIPATPEQERWFWALAVIGTAVWAGLLCWIWAWA